MSIADIVLIPVVSVVALIAIGAWLKARRAQNEGVETRNDHVEWRDYFEEAADGHDALLLSLSLDHNQYREGYRDGHLAGYNAATDHMDEWANGVDDNPDDDADFDPLDDTNFDHDDDEYERIENVEAVAEAIYPTGEGSQMTPQDIRELVEEIFPGPEFHLKEIGEINGVRIQVPVFAPSKCVDLGPRETPKDNK